MCYAKGKGFVSFGVRFNEDTVKEITTYLKKNLRTNWLDFSNTQFKPLKACGAISGTVVEFSIDDTYSGDDEIKGALDGICCIAPIRGGKLEYIGRDYAYWNLIYKYGEWKRKRVTIDISSLKPGALIRVHNERQTISLLSVMQKQGYMWFEGPRPLQPLAVCCPYREMTHIYITYPRFMNVRQIEYTTQSDPPLWDNDYLVDFSELIVDDKEDL